MKTKIAVVMDGVAAHVRFYANEQCEIEIFRTVPLSGAYDALIFLGRDAGPGARKDFRDGLLNTESCDNQ